MAWIFRVPFAIQVIPTEHSTRAGRRCGVRSVPQVPGHCPPVHTYGRCMHTDLLGQSLICNVTLHSVGSSACEVDDVPGCVVQPRTWNSVSRKKILPRITRRCLSMVSSEPPLSSILICLTVGLMTPDR